MCGCDHNCFFLIIKNVLLGITTLITATATTSTISIIKFNYLSIALLSFPITTAAIVTTLTATPTTATDIPLFQEKPGQGAAFLEQTLSVIFNNHLQA